MIGWNSKNRLHTTSSRRSPHIDLDTAKPVAVRESWNCDKYTLTVLLKK